MKRQVLVCFHPGSKKQVVNVATIGFRRHDLICGACRQHVMLCTIENDLFGCSKYRATPGACAALCLIAPNMDFVF
jgi:hypothetical protein